MRNYMKKKEKRVEESSIKRREFSLKFSVCDCVTGKLFYTVLALLVGVPLIFGAFASKKLNEISLGEEAMVEFASAPISATSTKKGVIAIPSGIVKANPFVPPRDLGSVTKGNDVPAFSLVEPPEAVDEFSDAARVMDTIVSGILYDKFSPSAILNIEGNDYLVKKGDVVNNYKVLNIVQDSVTVQLGANVYKAGIGEILTEGTLTHNDVSNLDNKFGGVK